MDLKKLIIAHDNHIRELQDTTLYLRRAITLSAAITTALLVVFVVTVFVLL